MAYLTARRYGLTKVEPNDAEKQGGWRKVWEHPSGLRAAKHPATGNWHVIEFDVNGQPYIRDQSFCSSLRAAARKIKGMVT